MLQITPLPAFSDNYHWLIQSPLHSEIWVVDPGDPMVVERALNDRNKQLTGILITHHHWDHVDGVPHLAKRGVRVIGPALKPIAETNEPVRDGDHFSMCGLEVEVIEVPGHTLNHIAFYVTQPDQPPLLFCGDTLFSAGCGRLFEGTPEQMFKSLNRLSLLPDQTRIYAAHEYTLSNLKFAAAVEPDNAMIATKLAESLEQRRNNLPTLPTNLGAEKSYNPFLRAHEPSVKKAVSARCNQTLIDDLQCWAELRRWKDHF